MAHNYRRNKLRIQSYKSCQAGDNLLIYTSKNHYTVFIIICLFLDHFYTIEPRFYTYNLGGIESPRPPGIILRYMR